MSRRLSLALVVAVAVITLAILLTRPRAKSGKPGTEDPPCFASHLGLPCN